MSTYMKQKSVHKYIGTPTCKSIKVKCHMQNKTWAYKANYRWETVTCKRCLEKRYEDK